MVCMLFTLASCGNKLSGKYSAEEDGVKVTYEFKRDGTFECSMDTFLGEMNFDGTYEIKGDEITLTYELLGEEVEEEYDFEKGRNYIKIDDTKLEKE